MDGANGARIASRYWIAGYLIATFGSAALLKSGTVSGWP
jgi:hypothetical protein